VKTHIIIFTTLLAVILYSTGCSRKAKLTNEYIDSLKTNYKSLIAAMDTSWKIMIEEDNRKLTFLKRLLLEVSYTNDFDTVKFTSLMQRLESLKTIRYDKLSMKDSHHIDFYDSLTTQLIPDIENYARSHPGYEQFPLMKELISSIDDLDNNVLFKRSDYDQTVDRFNDFVKANNEILKETYPDSDLNNKAVFRIIEN